jgi:hypothetical protein
MNTTRKPLLLKALGIVAATCIALVLALDTTIGFATPAEAAEATPALSGARLDALARPATATVPRRCDALDSFGNPVRPCRA